LYKYYKKLLESVKDIQEYIIESEMNGKLDKKDPYFNCYKSLSDLKEKFIEEDN